MPIAIPVREDFKNLIESLSLICFAKSLATVASFVWNLRITLKEKRKVRKQAQVASAVKSLYLARSAALSAAAATIIV